MGLGFNHGEAHWSYSGFHRFRERLIDTATRNVNGEIINDSLYILIKHSDCDGSLSPEECKLLIPRLQELIKTWSDNPYSDEGYDRCHANLLIKGMQIAIEEDVPLEFI